MHAFLTKFTESTIFLLINFDKLITPVQLLFSSKFLLCSLDNINRKENSTLRELRLKEKMMHAKPHTWLSRRRVPLSFLLTLIKSTTPSLSSLIIKFLLLSLGKIDRKETSTLCELRVKGKMMDVNPHTWQSRQRVAFFFSSLLPILTTPL